VSTLRVLLLSDDDGRRRALARTLAGGGVEVIEGAPGAKRPPASDVGLVLFDALGDSGDPLATIARLRAQWPREIPLVALGAAGGDDPATPYLEAGAQDFLAETELDSPWLARALRHVRQRHGAERRMREAHEALRRTERRYQSFVAASAQFLWLTDANGGLIEIDESWLRLAGLTLEEVRGWGWLKALHPDDREGYLNRWRDCLESGSLFAYEYRLQCADGALRWYRDRIVPVRDDGRVIEYIGAAEHITEQRRWQAALEMRVRQQAAIARLGRQALEGASLPALLERVVETVSATLNVEYSKVLERLPEGGFRLVAGVGWQADLAGTATVPGGPDSQAGYTLLAGRPVVVEDLRAETRFHGPALLTDHGVVSGLSVVIGGREGAWGVLGAHTVRRRSFTEDDVSFLEAAAHVVAEAIRRTAAENALAESEARYRAMVDLAPDMIFINRGDRIDFVNPAGLRLLRARSAEQVLGRSPLELFHRDDHALIRERIASMLEAPRQVPLIEERIIALDGAVVEVEVAAASYDAGGERVIQVICRDIAERKRHEAQLRESQRLEAIGQLTGGVAHDFNNLLTVILGNAELLAEALGSDPRLCELATMIRDAAGRGADLTQRLLAFARRQPLAPEPVFVNERLDELEGLLRRTLTENVELRVVRGADLWPAFVDAAQLEAALLNLALNARDAMPRGGTLTVETANIELDEVYAAQHVEVTPGPYVLLAVSDTGTGIAPGDLERVFDPFFSTKHKGTGLGLSMVHGFIKQSGGHVKVYSEAGEGTTVKLYLPRAESESPARPAPVKPPPDTGGHELVLVVEDDELVRRHAERVLGELGYRVRTAADGRQALAIIEGDPAIDLLFTDVIMPGGVSGPELAKAAAELRPGLRVLYTSGYTENAIVHHGRLDPGVHLLPKPYRRSDLARKIREALASDP